LRLRPLRTERAIAVEDAAPERDETFENASVPFVSWDKFVRDWEWEQGEHITAVGATGSGKTTLAVRLLERRQYVIALATKARDESLYPKLEKMGFVVTANPVIEDAVKTPKVIFRPRLAAPTEAAKEYQKEAFRTLLINVFNEGNWCLYGDEIRYLSQNLNLKTELETLWLQGRSLGVSMVITTQRPVSIPVLAFESATHLFLYKMADRVNVNRAAEFSSGDVELLRYWLPKLERYEVMYIDTRTGYMVRTKVEMKGK
jgi:hypothetical protein